eukprot:scaffold69972_cov53-Prasinocladus_malaysianus.AAC.1
MTSSGATSTRTSISSYEIKCFIDAITKLAVRYVLVFRTTYGISRGSRGEEYEYRSTLCTRRAVALLDSPRTRTSASTRLFTRTRMVVPPPVRAHI